MNDLLTQMADQLSEAIGLAEALRDQSRDFPQVFELNAYIETVTQLVAEARAAVAERPAQPTLTPEETDWLAAYNAHVHHMQVEAADRGWDAAASRDTHDRWLKLSLTYRERHGEPQLPMTCTNRDSHERARQLYAKRRAA
ncbi:MAG: hypothetical protein BGO49_24605 [Planctomycetales bacterium 71-10]|nr:MAG: hypothetical protein BGO49_24605 [Planctomycetales bacterium 71-10]